MSEEAQFHLNRYFLYWAQEYLMQLHEQQQESFHVSEHQILS